MIDQHTAAKAPFFELGINYWPRRSAMQMWKRFDIGECREDLARIASWGCSNVRFFLLWEDFQPSPQRVDKHMLDKALAFVEAAESHDLRCMPTLFTGHMSGVNWMPQWALELANHPNKFRTITGGQVSALAAADFYEQPLLDAQIFFAKRIGEALAGHRGICAWDLGNEFSNLRFPRSPDSAARWSAELAEALASTSAAGVTAGIHGDDFYEDRRIRPSSLCESHIYCTMHGYAMYSPFARSITDPEVVPFLSELAGSFSRKRVLMNETGFTTHGPRQDELEAKAAEYAYAVFDRLQRRGCLGAYWWCYADYAQEVHREPPFDLAPHELGFGVIRKDGSEKPVADALRRFASEGRTTLPAPNPIANEDTYYANLPESAGRLYSAYVSR